MNIERNDYLIQKYKKKNETIQPVYTILCKMIKTIFEIVTYLNRIKLM